MQDLVSQYETFFGISGTLSIIIRYLMFFVLCLVIHVVSQKYLVHLIRGFLLKSKNKWDDYFAKNKVLEMAMVLVPVIVFQNLAGTLPNQSDLLFRGLELAEVMIILLTLYRALDSAADLFEGPLVQVKKPIRGYVQLGKILLGIIVGIITLAIAMDKSPMLLLSGLGAMSAILLLVFKDTITSFVASLQITAFDIVTVGDWLEIPSLGVDGDVKDISLYQLKIQNWDKTISVVPISKLFEVNFRNWRGMTLSGGRRIKRSIIIDLKSVRFLEDNDYEKLSKVFALKDYINGKIEEVRSDNEAREASGVDISLAVNKRRLTNIGTFRHYVVAFLKSHPYIRQDMTFLVRQLSPNGDGLPIEIYVFSSLTEWASYENIQGDIFDHLLAIASEFDLKLYQRPSSNDMALLADTLSNK